MIKLDEEQRNNTEVSNLLNKWKVNNEFYNLQSFLKNAKDLFLKPNKVDKKSLSDYYIENNKYRVKRDSWDSMRKI